MLWGVTSRTKTVDEGVFHSPATGSDAPFRLVETHRWLTFCFVPVLDLGVISRHVECGATGAIYDEAVLDGLTDAELTELLTSAIRASIAAVAIADDVVTDRERSCAIEILREFVPGYGDLSLEDDLDQVGVVDLDEMLDRLATSLNAYGKERFLICAARVMVASSPVSQRAVREVKSIGLALDMSPVHIDGVIMHVESMAGNTGGGA